MVENDWLKEFGTKEYKEKLEKEQLERWEIQGFYEDLFDSVDLRDLFIGTKLKHHDLTLNSIANKKNISVLTENNLLDTKEGSYILKQGKSLLATHKLVDPLYPVGYDLTEFSHNVDVVGGISGSVSVDISNKLNDFGYKSEGMLDIEFFERTQFLEKLEEVVKIKEGQNYDLSGLKKELGNELFDDSEKIHLKYVVASDKRDRKAEPMFIPAYVGIGTNRPYTFGRKGASHDRFYRFDLGSGYISQCDVGLKNIGKSMDKFIIDRFSNMAIDELEAMLENFVGKKNAVVFAKKMKRKPKKTLDDVFSNYSNYSTIYGGEYDGDPLYILRKLALVKDKGNNYFIDVKKKESFFKVRDYLGEFFKCKNFGVEGFRGDGDIAKKLSECFYEFPYYFASEFDSMKFVDKYPKIVEKVPITLFSGAEHVFGANKKMSVQDALAIQSEDYIERLKYGSFIAATYLNTGFLDSIKKHLWNEKVNKTAVDYENFFKE